MTLDTTPDTMGDLQRAPHDADAEKAVLAAILTGHKMDGLDLNATDFWTPAHEDIWIAAQKISDSGRRPDPILITETDPSIDRMLLAEIVAGAGVHANTPAHARIVRDHSDRRWLADLCRGGLQRALSPNQPAHTAEHMRTALDERNRQRQQVVKLADILTPLVDAIENGTGTLTATTPWPDLDRWIRGFQPGRLYALAGRPGGGKSLAGQAIAAHTASRHGKAAFVASLEMTGAEYGTRFLAADSSVGQRSMESGQLTEGDWERISKSTARLSDWPVWINDSPRQSLGSIRADARQVAAHHDLGAIVIDYLQLMDPPDRTLPRHEQVGAVTRGLKRLAKELHVPVVLLAQLNREGAKTNRRPQLTDLRESGDIEQDSDVVILLHDPKPDEPAGPGGKPIEALVAKNRQGPTGVCDLLMQGQFARIVQPDFSPSKWATS